jgi:hypothetical protein
VISKVWLDTFWFVAGREEVRQSRVLDKAWLRSILPPYYAGHGYGLRVGPFAIRGGVCTPLYRDVDFEQELDVATYVTMGSRQSSDPHEIGEWQCSDDDQPTTETNPLTSEQPVSEPSASPTTTS